MALSSGVRLGPYEILAPLGAGGMGEVYKARDTRLHRAVAIKVLPAEVAADPDRLRRFEQEARAVAALNHPHILAIHDMGVHAPAAGPGSGASAGAAPPVHYLVTELLEGQTLAARIAEGALPAATAVDLGGQIVQALVAAHDKHIVHRDVKPANVFLTTDGQVKLLDFGIAKLVEPTAAEPEAPTMTARDATGMGALVGTVGYMAPEQVRGLPVDARTDLFAFGAVLYEMLAGQRAFAGDTAADTFAAILTKQPAPLLEPGRIVPASLQAVVTRCLEKRADDRFQSAKALGFALQAIGTASGSDVAGPAAPPPAPQTARWPRWWRWAALAGALGVVALVGAFVVPRLRAPAPMTSLGVLPFTNVSRDAEQDYWVDGMMGALISDLGQIRALRVPSRTSSMHFKGTNKTTPEIAKELNVHGIVEGEVLRDGNKVSVTVRLIDARQDRQLWSDTYLRDVTDVLALQREVVRQIASQIRVQLTAQEQRRLSVSRPVDPVVYDTTLRALNLVEHGTLEQEFRRAIAMFQSAVERDPGYAPAWAGLGLVTFQLSVAGFEFVHPKEVTGPAIAAAEKALTLDPDLPEAHYARAAIAASGEWNLAKAQFHFERALELRPGYGACHTEYAQFLLWGIPDLDRARVHLDRARELDPFSPYNSLNRVWYLNAMGQSEQAVEEGRRLFQKEPDNWTIPFNTGYANLRLGKAQEAVRDFEACLRIVPARPLAMLGSLGLAYGLAGRREDSRTILAEMEQASKRGYVSPILKAYVHIGLGQNDEAFRLLEKALEERIGSLMVWMTPSFGIDTWFKDPRVPDLIARIRRAVRMPGNSTMKPEP